MATNFNENSIVSSGGFKPSSKDTPLDIRTRVETEQDIYEIPNPYIGMIVYVKDTGKRFEILTLKEVDTGLTIKNVVDTYKQFTVDLEEYAKIEDVPTKVSELENDRGYAIEKNVDSKIEAINNTINSNTNTINSKINTINSNINTINTEIDNINTDLVGVSESIEGSVISVDSKDGYLKDVEILGNTIQNQNDLADIRSVGDKLENQELYEIPVLSTGKNLIDETKLYIKDAYNIKLKANTTYYFAYNRRTTSTGVYFMIKDTKGDKYVGGFTEAWATERTHSDYNYECYYTSKNITPLQDCIITYIYKNDKDMTNVILAESTQATPYEPFQEYKLTILSPTPLEKVGDVADRIVCKDGVWGVEKNIITKAISNNNDIGNTSSGILDNDKTMLFTISTDESWEWIKSNPSIRPTISSKFLVKAYNEVVPSNNIIEGLTYEASFTTFYVRILKENLKSHDKKGAMEYLIGTTLSYKRANPQFIPLPHDQQISIRTFANKTNISFGCEIEPTLKAQVPKSLGATVNSHSEQIDNLSKELQKINNLEESTVSTVTSESNFTTVENTNNGYFDDVKLKGKTLVNKFVKKAKMPSTVTENGNELVTNTSAIQTVTDLIKFNSDKITFIYEIKGNETITVTDQVLYFRITKNGGSTIAGFKGELTTSYRQVVQVIDVDKESEYVVELRNPCSVKNIMVLEGDHTQNPPEYFEGLKSVGQDVDEITIATTNAPMFFGKGGKK